MGGQNSTLIIIILMLGVALINGIPQYILFGNAEPYIHMISVF